MPDQELRAALFDLESVPAAQWESTRYVTLYNLPADNRPAAQAVVSYLLNAVSRQPGLVPPVPGAAGRLLATQR